MAAPVEFTHLLKQDVLSTIATALIELAACGKVAARTGRSAVIVCGRGRVVVECDEAGADVLTIRVERTKGGRK